MIQVSQTNILRACAGTHRQESTSAWDRHDKAIQARLSSFTDADEDFWAFRRGAVRVHAHGLSQYPAMMVPSMQEALLRAVVDSEPSVRTVADPFVGSGTTLVECMRLGLDFYGQDINPLAILLSKAKAGPYYVSALEYAAKDLLVRVRRDARSRIEAAFPGIEKWFSPAVARQLSRLRRAVRTEPSTWCRRIFWVCVAETARLTSNSRTSTFKLHVRPASEIRTRHRDPIAVFSELLAGSLKRLRDEAAMLRSASLLHTNGAYRGRISLVLGDSSEAVGNPLGPHDLLITSPPYGDNSSTVPYGQYSYLPLQWIDEADIDARADGSFLVSTHEIDSRSLGGFRKHAVKHVEHMLDVSPALRSTLQGLKNMPVDRAGRVAAFFRDLQACLPPITDSLRPGACLIWTVGNRRVGGLPVPMDLILTQLLASTGVRLVTKVQRRIPSKRMATKNSVSATMRAETILLYRKR